MSRIYVGGDLISSSGSGYTYAGTRYFFSDGQFEKANPLLTGDIGLRAIRVTAAGGGGGGGGTETTSGGQCSVSGSGNGGNTAVSFITDIAGLSASVTVTRGAGGTSPATGGGGGGTGGASSFGSLVIAVGGRGGNGAAGFGGTGSAPRGMEGAQAANAGGSVGDVVHVGSGGGFSLVVDATTNQACLAGNGGSSMLGGGGQATRIDRAANIDGQLYGGGGSGAAQRQNLASRRGGFGANGIVIVDCFV